MQKRADSKNRPQPQSEGAELGEFSSLFNPTSENEIVDGLGSFSGDCLSVDDLIGQLRQNFQVGNIVHFFDLRCAIQRDEVAKLTLVSIGMGHAKSLLTQERNLNELIGSVMLDEFLQFSHGIRRVAVAVVLKALNQAITVEANLSELFGRFLDLGEIASVLSGGGGGFHLSVVEWLGEGFRPP
jgi:hypothetical protein